MAENEQAIILFDGVCSFCDFSVNYVIDHDPTGHFKFAALQSDAGQRLLRQYDLPTDAFDTFVLIENGKVYTRSTAALKVTKSLKGPARFLAPAMYLPRKFRDIFYNLISKYRYKIFGMRDSCRIPTADERARFLV